MQVQDPLRLRAAPLQGANTMSVVYLGLKAQAL
jgi:hypothetical protein